MEKIFSIRKSLDLKTLALISIVIFILWYYVVNRDRPDSVIIEMSNQQKQQFKHIEFNSRIHLVNTPSLFSINSTLTIVSALYDINRAGRPIENYYDWLRKTLTLKAPFVFFVQKKYLTRIKELIPSGTRVMLVVIEIDELPLAKLIPKMTRIIDSDEYKKKIKYPDRIECTNPLYSVIQFSKFDFMEISAHLLNPFRSSKFVWVDAGASRFFDGFDLRKKLTGSQIPGNKLTVVLEKGRSGSDKEFKRKNYQDMVWGASNYFRGTMMASGGGNIISVVNEELKEELNGMLENGVVNNEQIALNLLYYRRPELLNTFDGGGATEWKYFLKYLI